MSSPTNLGQDSLKRLCRFLVGRKRLVVKYPWQRASTMECYSDTVDRLPKDSYVDKRGVPDVLLAPDQELEQHAA